MMHRLVALVVLTAGLAASIGGGAAPAAAATLPKDIAAQLRRSPLVVDPALAEAVPAAQRRAVLRAIKAAPYPVWAVLVPLTPGDRYGGDASRFLDVIHGRLGRDGVYVTVDDRLLTTAAFGVDGDDPDLQQASTVGNFESREYDEPQIAKVRRFVEVLSAPDLTARYARTEARLRRQREQFSARRPPPRPTVRTRVVAAAGCCPSACWRCSAPAACSCTGAATATPAQERQQHALDSYAAARRVLSSDPRMVDLVGALVLVEDGTRALAAAEAPETGLPVPARWRCASSTRAIPARRSRSSGSRTSPCRPAAPAAERCVGGRPARRPARRRPAVVRDRLAVGAHRVRPIRVRPRAARRPRRAAAPALSLA